MEWNTVEGGWSKPKNSSAAAIQYKLIWIWVPFWQMSSHRVSGNSFRRIQKIQIWLYFCSIVHAKSLNPPQHQEKTNNSRKREQRHKNLCHHYNDWIINKQLNDSRKNKFTNILCFAVEQFGRIFNPWTRHQWSWRWCFSIK